MVEFRLDIFENEVHVGDVVAFNPPHYKGVTTGKVLSFTPQGIRVKYIHSSINVDKLTVSHSFVKFIEGVHKW